ncbi:MAG: 2-C-methyl-D-erythritol 2,4-cyclodiphosphate synthase [Neisseriales bacterium]|nr:MAG: 2-C-methyl-D-erythritol 2,4-cyclodiphosphate synthase [Neisseriales bacterium]
MCRVGQGYDIHALVTDRPLILGGVTIPFELGLLGHSDADVLLHAIIDSLLGAAGLGDIGRHFPDHDPALRAIDSRQLLRLTQQKIAVANFKVANIDATVIAQAPLLTPYLDVMRQNIASDLQITLQAVNVKAKTNERFGYIGQGEAIVAQAIALCSQCTSSKMDAMNCLKS